MIEKLKQRWNVKNGWDVLIILTVFACTGFSILYIKRFLLDFLGIENGMSTWLRWTINIVVILPLYQAVLLFWGWIFGKYAFFLAFEKRMFTSIAKLFKKR